MARLVDNAEVIVVGGGVVGAAATRALASAGQRPLLFDQHSPGHPFGSSHGDGRIFRYTYPERVYVELARRAARGWAELEAVAGERLLEITGNWDCGPPGSADLAALERCLEAAELPFERLTAAESNQRFPQLRLPAESEALFQPDGGVVRASRAVAALWRLAARDGATALPGERVVGIDAGDGGAEVYCASGRRARARRLVLAGGAWSAGLLAQLDLALPLAVSRELVAYFAVRRGGASGRPTPPSHGVDALPTVIDYHTEKPFYALPQIDVPGVKVGWHHAGRPIASPDEETELDRDNLAALGRFVEQRFPCLETTAFETVQCLYTSTPDHHFFLAPHPTTPSVVVAAGFSGHGFKFGPALGEIVADLALARPPHTDLQLFRLDRHPAPAGPTER